MKKHLRIFSDARSVLFATHAIFFVLLLGLGITVFTLPNSSDSLLSITEEWDIFYKFLFSFLVDYAKKEYINLGTLLTVLAFLHLVSAFIVHGRFSRKFLTLNFISCLPLIIFFPIGLVLAAWCLSLVYIYYVQCSRLNPTT